VLFAWVMFRAADLDSALRLWGAMLGGGGPAAATIGAGSWASAALLLGVAFLCPNTQEIMARFRPALDTDGIRPARVAWRPGFAAALAISGIAAPALYFILFTDRVSDFLYFQF
jgi:hypothetical protein